MGLTSQLPVPAPLHIVELPTLVLPATPLWGDPALLLALPVIPAPGAMADFFKITLLY